ncbi:MAG: hypothetical protein JW788_02165 [Candidatus Omnitrophica bacterium]|nr:hypothetical protein [Candidatus Omnitrophota bacterium]
MQDKKQKHLGEILIEKGLIKEEDLEGALEEQKKTKEFLGAILVRNNLIEEKDLLQALCEHFGMELGSLENKYIDWGLVGRFSSSLVLENDCFPLSQEGNLVIMAITDPLNAWAQKKAEIEARGIKLKFVLVSAQDMREAKERYLRFLRSGIDRLLE